MTDLETERGTLDKSTGLQRARHLILRIILGSLLLVLLSYLYVPMWPVPITLQTLGIILLATHQGRVIAAGSCLLFLLTGPLFGVLPPLWWSCPTAGYLWAFPLAALVCRPRLGDYLFAHGVILLFGFLWLGILIGFTAAFTAGVLPFLIGDTLKSLGVHAANHAVRRT